MAARIGLKIGEWFYRNGKIKEDQIDMIRFAFEIICSEFTEIFIIILYSILTNQILQTILYLVFFQILRQFFQGYHAKTIIRCLILTVGTYLLSLSVYPIVPFKLMMLLLIISALLQIDYSIRKKQILSIIVSIILHVVVLLSSYLLHDMSYFSLLVITDFVVSISLIPERRENV